MSPISPITTLSKTDETPVSPGAKTDISIGHTARTETSSSTDHYRWVDYLPNQDDETLKQRSLDVTESHLTESQFPNDDELDWPDSCSLGDEGMVVPHVLLIENDPMLQHELLLASPPDSSGGRDVSTQQRLLWARMKASQQTRRRCFFLEPHIQQRASLAQVLQSIQDSSVSLRRHVLRCSVVEEEAQEQTDAASQKVTADSGAKTAAPESPDDDAMDVDDDMTDHAMLASALGLTDPEDIVQGEVSHEPSSDTMMVAEDDLPEPPELTAEDIDAVDFSSLDQDL